MSKLLISLLLLFPVPLTWSFLGLNQQHLVKYRPRSRTSRFGIHTTIDDSHVPTIKDSYVMSTVEKARTVASACTSATLCSLTDDDNSNPMPFGSHVDYVLDSNGFPALLLHDQSIHTGNIKEDPRVSLFAQMPATTSIGQPSAAMSRVTLMGKIQPVDDKDEILSLRTLYSVTHSFAQCLVDSKHFHFYKLIPNKIFYAGGYGVDAQYVKLEDYFNSKADPLALQSLSLVNKINYQNRQDLQLLCTEFIPEFARCNEQLDVKVTTIDRLGFDIRVASRGGAVTEEFRIGFMVKILSLEDAKSEIGKTFQNAWEKSMGDDWEGMVPPLFLTNRDILGCDEN
mmetsp:Transcript_12408/g.15996  ORF Transcript_12408/g.15996 Transcript_12408/m.15996 type:complete len:341 (-) Transcript_12408:250-1272(-)